MMRIVSMYSSTYMASILGFEMRGDEIMNSTLVIFILPVENADQPTSQVLREFDSHCVRLRCL